MQHLKEIFPWDKEITVPIELCAPDSNSGGNYVNVPITAIDRDFCCSFNNPESETAALREVEIKRIQSLVVPLEFVSIIPILGFQTSLSILGDTNDFSVLSFRRRAPRSAEIWDSLNQLTGHRIWWLQYIRLMPFDKSVKRYSQYTRSYLKLWHGLTEHPAFTAVHSSARAGFDKNLLDNFSAEDKVFIIDKWLSGCHRKISVLLRLRNGLTPNYGVCTQEEVGRVLTLSQSAISHSEIHRSSFRARNFAQFIRFIVLKNASASV